MKTREQRRQRREDKQIVREGSNSGAGGVPTVTLYAMLASEGSVESREYVERYIAARERLEAG